MPIQMDQEPNDVFVLRISGTLQQSEFGAEQKAIGDKIDAGAKPRVLVVGENFEGWERGADWNDLDFMLTHGGKIEKIAVVAEPRWEAHALAFAGAGLRKAPVKFCPSGQVAQARTWLVSDQT